MNSFHDCNNLNVFVVVVSITKQKNQNSLGIALMLIGHRRNLCKVSTELNQVHVDGHSKMVSGNQVLWKVKNRINSLKFSTQFETWRLT